MARFDGLTTNGVGLGASHDYSACPVAHYRGTLVVIYCVGTSVAMTAGTYVILTLHRVKGKNLIPSPLRGREDLLPTRPINWATTLVNWGRLERCG